MPETEGDAELADRAREEQQRQHKLRRTYHYQDKLVRLRPVEKDGGGDEYSIERVDERALNELLPGVSDEVLKTFVRRNLPPPARKRIINRSLSTARPCLTRVVRDLGLLDEPSARRRLDIFLGYCRLRSFAYRTVSAYYRELRRTGLFEDPKEVTGTRYVAPSRISFDETGRKHQRAVSMRSFARLVKHLNEGFSRYTAPLLVAVHTGLRTAEILQWSARTLHQLTRREQDINSVVRKNTLGFGGCVGHGCDDKESIYWRPVYNTHLIAFVDRLAEALYRDEYVEYAETGLDSRLFPVTRGVLVNRIKAAYSQANDGIAAPFGFGIHSCRNMMAKLMSTCSDNIAAIQAFMQHRSINTTRIYINSDFRETAREFDRLTRNSLAGVTRALSEGEEKHARKKLKLEKKRAKGGKK